MPYPQKASNADLLKAYDELRSVQKVGARFGMCGQSVHERLVKLNAIEPPNYFTPVDDARLLVEYGAAANAGRLDELAAAMGRTKSFICRQARRLGLTDQRRASPWQAVWKYKSEAQALAILRDFQRSDLGLRQYCGSRGYDDLGFSLCMKRFFAAEYEVTIEAKAPLSSWYRLGRQLEYRVRDELKRLGYFAMRSPGSKSPIDVMGVRPGAVLFIQCKRGGVLGRKEWNELFSLAKGCGALPILASCPTGRGAAYRRITAPKDGSTRRQPMVPFDPARPALGSIPPNLFEAAGPAAHFGTDA